MDVKLALCQMIGQSTGMGNDLHDLNEKDIVHKQKLCMEILNVANIISPGVNFINNLRATFVQTDPKSTKRH
jgi:hypothetical protein